MTSKLGTVLLVGLLLISAVGPAAITAGASSSSSPSGMVKVPDSNVEVVDPNDKLPELDGLGDAFGASSNAGSLNVSITTREQASSMMGDKQVLGQSEAVIVLEDNTAHAGRSVSIDDDLLRKVLGYEPQVLRGVHSSGGRWTEKASYQDGFLVVDIESFSSNTISFGGQVTIDGNPAVDGASYNYKLSDADSVGDFDVNFTGVRTTEWDNNSGNIIMGKEQNFQPNVAGNMNATGPSENNNPRATFTVSDVISMDINSNNLNGLNIPDNSSKTTELDVSAFKSVNYLGVRLLEDSTLVGENDSEVMFKKESMSNWANISYKESTNGPTHFLDFRGSGGVNVSNSDILKIKIVNTDLGYADIEVDNSYNNGQKIPKLNVSDSNNDRLKTFNFRGVGDSGTMELNLIPGEGLNFEGSLGFDYEIDLKERTQTYDPTVEINGNEASHSGPLIDGATTGVSVNSSWIKNGTNRINVSVASALSSDAPTPSVGFQFQHRAASNQSVEYSGNQWTEEYNVSHTYASDKSEATVTIPFVSSVASIESLEVRRDGGSWSTLSAYSLNATKLRANLGAVSAGERIDVRATGQKINVNNGTISVLDPSVMGSQLDTNIRVDSWGKNAYIDVTDTKNVDRLHHLYNESWQNPSERAKITKGGTQKLFIPSAGVGSTARITTLPLEVIPEKNDVELEVVKASSTEPEIHVYPGDSVGETVKFRYSATKSGQEYRLFSVTNEKKVDSAVAQSPVTLVGDDSDELLRIELVDDDTANQSGGGGGGLIAPVESAANTQTPLGVPVFVIAPFVAIAGLWLVSRRIGATNKGLADWMAGFVKPIVSSRVGLAILGVATAIVVLRMGIIDPPDSLLLIGGTVAILTVVYVGLRRTNQFSAPVYVAVSAVTVILAAESIAPGSIIPTLASGVKKSVPLLSIGALVLGYLWLKNRGKEASSPDKVLNLKLGRNNDK